MEAIAKRVITDNESSIDLHGFDMKQDETSVALIVQDIKLWVSRGLLASYSNYFRKIFFAEQDDEKIKEVYLQNEELVTFITFFRCVVPRPFLLEIDDNNVISLAQKAHFYEVPDLTHKCSEFLIHHWAESTDPTKLKTALQLGCRCKMNGVITACLPMACESPPGWKDACLADMPRKLIAYLWQRYCNRTPECLFQSKIGQINIQNESYRCEHMPYTPGKTGPVGKMYYNLHNEICFCENCSHDYSMSATDLLVPIIDVIENEHIKCEGCHKILFSGGNPGFVYGDELGSIRFCCGCTKVYFCESCNADQHLNDCMTNIIDWFQ